MREQVAGFLRRGYEPLTFFEATRNPHRKVLAVTFDDAYRSVPELGLPVLAELGVPATVFVPTADMASGALRSWPGIEEWANTRWANELAGAGWDELEPLSAAGWEIGSHTRTHPHLVSLGDEELHEELHGSRRDCAEATGLPCRSLAYPFGEADARVAAAAHAAGYEVATTLADRIPRPANGRPNPMLWPRLGVHEEDTPARLRIKSRLFLHARPAWNAAQAVRRAAR